MQSFNFIMPNFNEPSEVFICRKNYNIIKAPEESKGGHPDRRRESVSGNKKNRLMSFNVTNNYEQEEFFTANLKPIKLGDVRESKIIKEKSMIGDHEGADKCILWEDIKEGDEIPETLEAFVQRHINQLRPKN